MAKKKKETEEIIATPELESQKVEASEVNEAKVEKSKPAMMIIAKTSVPFRRKPNLEQKYVVGKMQTGTAYRIAKEVKSIIYGSFYLLSNGYYITKDGNYTII